MPLPSLEQEATIDYDTHTFDWPAAGDYEIPTHVFLFENPERRTRITFPFHEDIWKGCVERGPIPPRHPDRARNVLEPIEVIATTESPFYQMWAMLHGIDPGPVYLGAPMWILDQVERMGIPVSNTVLYVGIVDLKKQQCILDEHAYLKSPPVLDVCPTV